MAEITRFRLARTAERRLGGTGGRVPVHGRRVASTDFTDSLIKVLGDSMINAPPVDEPAGPAADNASDTTARREMMVERLGELASDLLTSENAFDPYGVAPPEADELLRGLDRWLVSQQFPSVSEVQDQLVEAARGMNLGKVDASTVARRISGTQAWSDMRGRLGDSVMASLLATSRTALERDRGQRLTRLVLVAGLIETLAEDPPGRPDDAETIRALLQRTPVLPSPPFPIFGYLSSKSVLARAPAFSDLYVVRDEWSCYLPAEIAHIENILRGEYKSRLHRRVDERETTETRETDELTIDERDLQSTDRALLREESTQATDLSISVEGEIDTSGQYGPTRVQTHIGASVEYSVSESRQRATEQAKEIIQRAVNRTERRVRELRTTRTLSRVEEENRHIIDNAEDP